MDEITNDLKKQDFPPISEQKSYWKTQDVIWKKYMQQMDAMSEFFSDLDKALQKLHIKLGNQRWKEPNR